jgi:stress response protein YsnF
MELTDSETNNNNDSLTQEESKNKVEEDLTANKNPLVISPLQSEKLTIVIQSPSLENKKSIKSKIEGALESVKENASNVVDKVIKVEEQDINSFKRDTESISQSQQQQSIEQFVIPVVAENYSFSKKILSEDISIEKRWIEKDEIKIPVRYEKLFVNNKEIDVYSKQGIISQIKEKISDLVQSDNDDDNGNVNKMKENEDDDNKNQKHKKDIENQKREEPQLKGESVPLFDNQQTENSNEQLYQDNNNNKELINNNKYQTLIPLYAEEITVSKKMVKVGEIVLSKRRIVETENVDVDTIKERINVEHADGRKEKIN